jgi:hypothetical protein
MNHGTVVAEAVEYRDQGERIVVCELKDGWHVVEVYRPGARTIRHVVETLAEAREWAIGRLS